MSQLNAAATSDNTGLSSMMLNPHENKSDLALHQREENLLQGGGCLRQSALQMADHHAHSDPRQLVTQARVLPHQLNQLSPDGHGHRLRDSGAARGAFSDRRGGNRPFAFGQVHRSGL